MRLVVARIGRAHGIRGEVTIEVRTDAPGERFVPGARLHLIPPPPPASLPADHANRSDHATRSDHADRTVTLASVRDHNGTLLLGFDDVADRTAAEALRGALLEADVPAETGEPDAWYEHQLLGLRVVAPDGAALGEVVAVEHPPAQDLLVVRRPDGEQRLVPFVAALVPAVDVAAGLVVVDAPPGLLDDVD